MMLRAISYCSSLIAVCLAFSTSAQADAECEAEFRALLRQEKAGFPYMSTVVTTYGGKSSTSYNGAKNKHHALTKAENGTWYLVVGRTTWESSDKGESWKKLTQISQKLFDKSLVEQEQQAQTAHNIECADNVEHEGATYRLVKGRFEAANGTGITFDQSYYVDESGTWAIVISDITIGKTKSLVTQTKTESGPDVMIPDPPGK